ncbi:hypothetical protein MGSAQ_000967 [marine sediment metagenome]|uniref:Uncharacterized protein n=1 Tax=marine sediment metagenome TaxID=412755 RepID=A0A1B6NXR1_9ZZZZ
MASKPITIGKKRWAQSGVSMSKRFLNCSSPISISYLWNVKIRAYRWI